MEVYCLCFPAVVRLVMFGKKMSQIFHSGFLENMEILLFGSILNPIEMNIHGFWSFLEHCIVCNAMCSGIFGLHCCCWLGVSHFLQGGMGSFCFLEIVLKGSNFCLFGWSHFIFIMLGTVCTATFFSLLFVNFFDPMKKLPPGLMWSLSSDN